jgi:thiamine pyrophosphate-dependent acetolactate synthase large subunit-like protein
LCEKNKRAIIVGSLGSISKDLSEIPHKRKVLVKGAMGCAMAVGLGIALNTKKKVIVLTGDGSFLMKLGSISTILKYSPKNLKIIVLNNNCYASCGGQKINFDALWRSVIFRCRETFNVLEI